MHFNQLSWHCEYCKSEYMKFNESFDSSILRNAPSFQLAVSRKSSPNKATLSVQVSTGSGFLKTANHTDWVDGLWEVSHNMPLLMFHLYHVVLTAAPLLLGGLILWWVTKSRRTSKLLTRIFSTTDIWIRGQVSHICWAKRDIMRNEIVRFE